MENSLNVPPEEKIGRLRDEGRISEAEYQDLLAAITQRTRGGSGTVEPGPSGIPLSLKIVAVLFIISGIFSVIEVVVALMHGGININFGVLCLFVGPGLLRLHRGWRTCALVFLWLGLIVAPIVFVLGLSGKVPAYFSVFGVNIARIPGWWASVAAIPFFLLMLWQYRVLTRPDIRRLFGLPIS